MADGLRTVRIWKGEGHQGARLGGAEAAAPVKGAQSSAVPQPATEGKERMHDVRDGGIRSVEGAWKEERGQVRGKGRKRRAET